VLKNAAGSSLHISISISNSTSTSISRNEHLFTPQASELIFKRSGGIPRRIATIMEQALIYGSAHQLSSIDENVIYNIEPEL
jgi:type II secretory pathway predicted ATPase ExeA